MMKQQTNKPTAKVRAGGIAGLITAVVAIVAWWLNSQYGLNIDATVQAAATVVLLAVVPPIVAYYTRPSPLDTPVPVTKPE